ncbi:hypothetical protein J6590_090830 [Homalodisca vitripennis]|nr:hypothetical protein J6590_090830 [Homalodisca vitripennis]
MSPKTDPMTLPGCRYVDPESPPFGPGEFASTRLFDNRLKRVIVTPAVYPRLLEFLHFDIQSNLTTYLREQARSSLEIQQINADLLRVRLWADDHGLQLNPRKCSLVNFYPSSNAVFLSDGPLGVSFGGVPLQVSDTVKILDVTFDKQLTFLNHV